MKADISNFINIYCDESRVENVNSQFMVIGALFVHRDQKRATERGFREICRKFDFQHEIKWTKVGGKFKLFYQALIDYFVANNDLRFRCIIIDKKKVDYAEFHDKDEELAFFKFYYLMLRQKLLDFNRYYVFLDKKPTRDKNRARALHSFLDSYVLLHKRACTIEHLQAYHSHDILLLQIADFLTGLVGYSANISLDKRSAKSEISEYLKSKLNIKDFLSTSWLSEDKFNIFVWNPE